MKYKVIGHTYGHFQCKSSGQIKWVEDSLTPITKTAVLCYRSSELSTFIWLRKLNCSPQSASRAGHVVDAHVVVQIAGEDAASDDGLSARGDTGKKNGDRDALENGNRVHGGLRKPGIIPSELQADISTTTLVRQ